MLASTFESWDATVASSIRKTRYLMQKIRNSLLLLVENFSGFGTPSLTIYTLHHASMLMLENQKPCFSIFLLYTDTQNAPSR